MRTGSNLLERNLSQFKKLVVHGELFNPSFIGKSGRESYLDFDFQKRNENPFDLIEAARASMPEKVHGFRIFQGHNRSIFEKILEDPECGRIILERNPLDSFLSLKIARATQQWMLRDESKRRAEKVGFVASEFEEYLEERTEFYMNIRNMLQSNGQTAMWIDYDRIQDNLTLNGIASYLGVDEKLNKFAQITLRQNPEPVWDKVTNPQDLPTRQVGAASDFALNGTILPTKRLLLCRDIPLIFAPIRAGIDAQVTAWMESLSNDDRMGLATFVVGGLDRSEFAAWRRKHSAATMFTVIRHPLIRAFDAYLNHIARASTQPFPSIQQHLEAKYDLKLPEIGDENPATIRGAFHQFLAFLERNLLGATNIRTDQNWAAQTTLIAGYSKILPLSLIAREGQWVRSAKYLEESLGVTSCLKTVAGAAAIGNESFLAEIYNSDTEALSRRAYAADYANFGWGDWA